MKVSGFTFCRNVIKYDFPILESIQSILPIVDEYVVNVGKSEDDTLDLIRSIKDDRIKIVETVWDNRIQKDGQVFGIQQDIALSHCTGDWAFLLQADEVVHEDDLEVIKQAMERYWDNPNLLGLIFRMIHFKGDYWSVDPWMYRKATRIVRNNGRVRSTTDCCDFRTQESPQMIKSGSFGRLIPARIFHYCWVKDPSVLRAKRIFQLKMFRGDRLTDGEIDAQIGNISDYPTYDILKEFLKTHPKAMYHRISCAKRLRSRVNRWFNWRFYREIFRHGFKG